MNQQERRIYLIQELLKENPTYSDTEIPETSEGQRQLLRGLMNIRMPEPVGEKFLFIYPNHGCIDNAIPFSITQSCMQSGTAHG